MVVRLKTSSWVDDRGLHVKKSLTYMRRQCRGHNFLEETVTSVGANGAVEMFVNLHNVKDGLYEVGVTNQSTCPETHIVDGCDFVLRPLEGQ